MRLALSFIIAAAIGFVPCSSQAKQPKDKDSAQEPEDITARANEWIAEWAISGMYLPKVQQREFFRSHRDQLASALQAALAHENDSVRMRAAYVIEYCGPSSKSLASMLLQRVPMEKDRLVRIYIYNALCTHGPAHPDAAAILSKRWDALDRKAIVSKVENEPSEASEAVYVAGALSACSKDQATRKQYASFVLGWLETPPASIPADKLDAYWDIRWSALAALRSMPVVDGVVPLLQKMLHEPNTKPWVDLQVKATLEVQGKKK